MSSQLESQAGFEATQLGFIWRQFTRPKPLPSGTRLDGQVGVVTGSNVGLGLEASRQLLGLGLAHLIVAVRSPARGEEAATKLRAEFPAATISVWTADLESYESIRAFADRCRTLPRLDIAILNAGLIKQTYEVNSNTGHESTLQVNYLSTAFLALLLLPIMRRKKVSDKKGPPVLTLVGSDLAYGAVFDTTSPILPQFDRPKAFKSYSWYANSKLALIFFVAKLASIVNPDEVLVNLANPGMTSGTAFFRDTPGLIAMLMGIAQIFLARSAAVGASTYVDAVVARGPESHGSFLSDWAIKP